MNFSQLQNAMQLEEELTSEKLVTSQRTFQRDIEDIASIYGIEIISDRSTREYKIVENTESQHSQRIRENFDLINAIRLSGSFKNNLIFEERKSLGTEHMAGLLHAIQNHLEVSFSYLKFNDGSQKDRRVRPVALKESRHRWYLIGAEGKGDKIKNFGLDRILDLRITEDRFTPLKEHDIEESFRHSFGIINGTHEEPEEVILSFTPQEGKYLLSLPLHHSQELIAENEGEFRFSYFIRPTHDFRMEILSYGNHVRVIQPESLKKVIAEKMRLGLSHYAD